MEHLLHTHALLAVLPLVPSLGSDGTLPLKVSSLSSHSGFRCFYRNLALKRGWEYVCVVRVLAPLASTLASLDNVTAL